MRRLRGNERVTEIRLSEERQLICLRYALLIFLETMDDAFCCALNFLSFCVLRHALSIALFYI